MIDLIKRDIAAKRDQSRRDGSRMNNAVFSSTYIIHCLPRHTPVSNISLWKPCSRNAFDAKAFNLCLCDASRPLPLMILVSPIPPCWRLSPLLTPPDVTKQVSLVAECRRSLSSPICRRTVAPVTNFYKFTLSDVSVAFKSRRINVLGRDYIFDNEYLFLNLQKESCSVCHKRTDAVRHTTCFCICHCCRITSLSTYAYVVAVVGTLRHVVRLHM